MSRSYKKSTYCVDQKGKIKKRFANKRVRQWLKDNPNIKLNKGDFKKLYESYDICDYSFYNSWESYWNKCLKYHKEDVERGYGEYLELDYKREYTFWLKRYKLK